MPVRKVRLLDLNALDAHFVYREMIGQASILSKREVVGLDNSRQSQGSLILGCQIQWHLTIRRLHSTASVMTLIRPSRLMSTGGSGARDKNTS